MGQLLGTQPEDGKGGEERGRMEAAVDANMVEDLGEKDDKEVVGEDEEALQTTTAPGWSTQENLPGGTTLVDAQNGFNDMRHLTMC